MSNKIFISYHVDDEGKRYKNLLVAWSENDRKHFNISFDDTSVGVSINSTNASYVKSVIQEKIKESPVFLCLIGKYTNQSDWVAWEIEKALGLQKKIVAVKIDNQYTSPTAILNVGASWAKSFNYASIKAALDG